MGTLVKQNGRRVGDIPTFFDDFFTKDLFGLHQHSFNNVPAVNIRETNDSFEIELATPGLKKEDFTIELNNKVLTISAEKNDTTLEEGENFKRREFSYHSFKRSFNVSEKVIDQSNISADYLDGILKITLAKRDEEKIQPTRRIEIK